MDMPVDRRRRRRTRWRPVGGNNTALVTAVEDIVRRIDNNEVLAYLRELDSTKLGHSYSYS